MTYTVMACIVMAYIVMAYTVMAYIVMAYIGMTYIVMAYTGMAYIVMAAPAELRFRQSLMSFFETVGMMWPPGGSSHANLRTRKSRVSGLYSVRSMNTARVCTINNIPARVSRRWAITIIVSSETKPKWLSATICLVDSKNSRAKTRGLGFLKTRGCHTLAAACSILVLIMYELP